MPNQTESALTRHWNILVRLILELRLWMAKPGPIPRARHRHVLHLLRLSESLARRWLILNAAMRPFRTIHHKTASSGKPPVEIARSQSTCPRLRLVEPLPVIRPGDYAFRPFETLPVVGASWAWIETKPPCRVALTHRARALLDVMRRPEYHTARMARWLARAADRARTTCSRYHPLGVGRPPGARRRQKKSAEQRALWWLDRLARDSLQPGWEP
ncbi:MAG: hypothetical protein AAGA89_08760 [Pseudomonadota bacterium]